MSFQLDLSLALGDVHCMEIFLKLKSQQHVTSEGLKGSSGDWPVKTWPSCLSILVLCH